MPLRALNDVIIVKTPTEKTSMTKGGLHLPENRKDGSTVVVETVSVGQDVEGKLAIPLNAAGGQRIVVMTASLHSFGPEGDGLSYTTVDQVVALIEG